MKRKILLVITLSLTFILTSCGMTPEEIDTALTDLNSAYESGTYDQAEQEIEKLDKSYKKMSDEQKNKFGELRNSVEYAASSAQSINDGLNNAQSFYDQKLYYEAQQELDKISQNYKLPPSEQKKFDEKQVAIGEAIKSWKITEAFQKVETAFNGGDYTSAETNLSQIDVEILSEDQKQTYQTWQKKIDSAKALAQAESYYNKGSYTSASNTLSGVDTAYLTSEQNQKYGSLKEKIANAIAEAERKKKEISTISADKVKQLVISHYGCASAIFNKEDDDFYYLVPYARYNQIMDTYEHPMGYCKVDKKTGQVIELAQSAY